MKNLLFPLLITVFMYSGLSYADVYIVHKNGDIYSISEANDAVVPAGYTVKVLKGKIDDLGMTRHQSEYKLSGSKLVPDTVKIKANEDRELARQEKVDKELNDKQSAITKLKALGLSESEISAIIRKE